MVILWDYRFYNKHVWFCCQGVVVNTCFLYLQVDSEEPVFEAVLNWVKHNRKERETYLSEMLEHVRMPLLTPRYITDVIDSEVRQLDHTRSHDVSSFLV